MIEAERPFAMLTITRYTSTASISTTIVEFSKEETKSSISQSNVRVLPDKEKLTATLTLTKPFAEVWQGE